MMMSQRTWRARAAGVSVMLLGLCYLVQVPRLADAATYLGVLAGSGVVIAALAASRLWTGGYADGRVLGCFLAVAGITSHLLNLLIGLPGASALAGEISTATTLAVCLELSTLLLLATEPVRRPVPVHRGHPYAL